MSLPGEYFRLVISNFASESVTSLSASLASCSHLYGSRAARARREANQSFLFNRRLSHSSGLTHFKVPPLLTLPLLSEKYLSAIQLENGFQ